MKNTYKLVWSEEATKGLESILAYLELNFSTMTARKFAAKFAKQLAIIQKTPKIHTFSQKSELVRRALVAKLTSIYYVIEGDEVRIVSIRDNRRSSPYS
ncbi:MAG: type II toxin-antitoxin system RelE/ParE family toxin [Mangrovibacterium sp.]